MIRALLLTGLVLAVALTGCGQKGPLVLPDAQHPHKKVGVPKPRSSPGPITPAPSTPMGGPPAPSQPATSTPQQ